MPIRLISAFIISLSFIQVFAKSVTSEDQIKSCLADIFASQSAFHKANKTYAQNEKQLSLAQNPDCSDLKLEVKEAKNDRFSVEVSDGTQAWKIDSSKTMTKLK